MNESDLNLDEVRPINTQIYKQFEKRGTNITLFDRSNKFVP